jgi:hypothetical protein
MNVDDGALFADFVFFDEAGSATVRVAPGRYHIMGFVVGGNFDTFSMVGDPRGGSRATPPSPWTPAGPSRSGPGSGGSTPTPPRPTSATPGSTTGATTAWP